MIDSRIQATVEVLTHNSGKTLRAALQSVKDFAEIIVVDGNSTDDTLDIAREYGARIIKQDARFLNPDGSIADFASVRNQGLSAATHPWFFFLDSDEEASRELLERVREVVSESSPGAYWVNRQYVFGGVVISCSASYPNRQMRLFHRSCVEGFKKKIHERVGLLPDVIAQVVKESILVPSEGADALKRKMKHYLSIEVDRLSVIGRGALLQGVTGGAKGMIGFIARFLHSVLFCRGARLPLSYELRPFLYQLKLTLRCLWRLIRL